MSLLLALWLALGQGAVPAPQEEAPLDLEIRVFDGQDEVTSETRIHVYRAGERAEPLYAAAPAPKPPVIKVRPGQYDIHVIRERNGRVLALRWAEHVPVLRYRDEPDTVLEVVNFRRGYGAVQVRGRDLRAEGAAIVPAGDRAARDGGRPVTGKEYLLFVVPAGRYDIHLRGADEPVAFEDIEVLAERVRALDARARAGGAARVRLSAGR
jgi:hypothetical protein